ncbi:flagellar basal-body rod protein FlgG [Rhodobium orientis]|uniref:Flagellar basal-body rod protein FlgG n=2 Tax=Rhodobium TaxID=34016 RepID=A0A327JH74_9HYPH|nr:MULTISPECIES: flagellar basal-body rod protein FlgG [Rhodobium]MBB4301821.1 flagellar basal-body rod protein FlgG [Rhodobium orientis]MBK5948405.1 flagellar basal-body rod protein FlgG [Rhodobium orientis]MCW2308325.1 flagellar basal-body rod protein FlgG [Rhodobium gokarnense]RAI24654.1 flagellar basal-body rod protein FlgG [Rhodobium orientis]
MRALYSAATGMLAQELNVEITSNNVANMRTTGFKRQRAEFQDLLYSDLRRVGATTSETGTMVPSGVQIGSGVRTVATPRVLSQGSISPTEKELDVAIRGDGFFRIRLPDGTTAYTRDGSFERDAEGQLVTSDGYILEPGITIPDDTTSITINQFGQVEATIGGQTAPQNLGQIELARFANKGGLQAIGDNMFLETVSSGPEQTDNPGAEGYGNLLQAHLEMSNVNAVTEIADLIAAQRAYEMNARVIKGADEMLSTTANLR